MPPTLEQRFAEAVKYFWTVRSFQGERQRARKADAGERSSVTGGGHCRGFATLICDLLVEHGIPDVHVFFKRERQAAGAIPTKKRNKQQGTELPGYFRATKDWDLVVVADGELIATVEFKSQVGPSFGNNVNNRAEEAVGNAVDLKTAFREGAYRPTAKPWLGFFALLEDCEKSLRPVKVKEPHFAVFPAFKGASYAKRWEVLCERLVREELYDAACFVLSPRDSGPDGDYREPNAEIAFRPFIASLIGHATAVVKGKRL